MIHKCYFSLVSDTIKTLIFNDRRNGRKLFKAYHDKSVYLKILRLISFHCNNCTAQNWFILLEIKS